MRVVEKVENIVRAKVADMGYELDDVEFAKENGSMVLTLYIYGENGIKIEDCERVSRSVEPLLDEIDPIEGQYYLSVSSIGIDRPLKRDRDFERNLGKDIIVKLYVPIEKKKEFIGTLKCFDAEEFTITLPKGQTMEFTRKQAALVKPHIVF